MDRSKAWRDDWRSAFETKRQTQTHTHTQADWPAMHCKKYLYIHGHFVASFPYFNGTGSVYVCIVNRRNSEVRAHIGMSARTSLFCRFTHRNVYGTGSAKIWTTRHKISADIRILQCLNGTGVSVEWTSEQRYTQEDLHHSSSTELRTSQRQQPTNQPASHTSDQRPTSTNVPQTSPFHGFTQMSGGPGSGIR